MINVNGSTPAMTTLRKFLVRFIKAAIQGASSAFAASFVDPEHFWPFQAGWNGWKHFGAVLLAGAIFREMLFLKAWAETSNNND